VAARPGLRVCAGEQVAAVGAAGPAAARGLRRLARLPPNDHLASLRPRARAPHTDPRRRSPAISQAGRRRSRWASTVRRPLRRAPAPPCAGTFLGSPPQHRPPRGPILVKLAAHAQPAQGQPRPQAAPARGCAGSSHPGARAFGRRLRPHRPPGLPLHSGARRHRGGGRCAPRPASHAPRQRLRMWPAAGARAPSKRVPAPTVPRPRSAAARLRMCLMAASPAVRPVARAARGPWAQLPRATCPQ
jgi:hypothetical protein